jgi:hypothetical protein
MKLFLAVLVLAGIAFSQAVSSYIPSTKTVRDPNFCKRVVMLMQAHPGRAITTQNDGEGQIQDCLDVDLSLNNVASTVYFGGGANGAIRSDVGFHIGDRDRFIGENVGSGGNSVSNETGTNFMASSKFPTGRANGAGVTATGNAKQSTVSLALDASGPGLIIGPLEEFRLAGDATRYTFGNCTGTCAPGIGKWYVLPAGGSETFNIVPPLKTSPSNTPVRLIHGLFRFGDQWHGSPQAMLLATSFLNGDSMQGNSGIGFGIIAGQEPQENSFAEDVYLRNISQAIKIMHAHRSGTWRNLNVAYTSDSRGCPTPGDGMPATIPMELAPYNTTIDGFTLYVGPSGPCTPKQMIYGGIHITDSPLFTQAFGVLRIFDWHVEMNGDLPDGTTSGDGVLIDASSGNIELDNGTLCPKSSACKNGIRVTSNFGGTLSVTNTSCNAKGGTTNFIADEVNGNVLPCAAILNATGFYRITALGVAMTDIACNYLTNGWCFEARGWRHFSNGKDNTIEMDALFGLVILLFVLVGLIALGLLYLLNKARKEK